MNDNNILSREKREFLLRVVRLIRKDFYCHESLYKKVNVLRKTEFICPLFGNLYDHHKIELIFNLLKKMCCEKVKNRKCETLMEQQTCVFIFFYLYMLVSYEISDEENFNQGKPLLLGEISIYRTKQELERDNENFKILQQYKKFLKKKSKKLEKNKISPSTLQKSLKKHVNSPAFRSDNENKKEQTFSIKSKKDLINFLKKYNRTDITKIPKFKQKKNAGLFKYRSFIFENFYKICKFERILEKSNFCFTSMNIEFWNRIIFYLQDSIISIPPERVTILTVPLYGEYASDEFTINLNKRIKKTREKYEKNFCENRFKMNDIITVLVCDVDDFCREEHFLKLCEDEQWEEKREKIKKMSNEGKFVHNYDRKMFFFEKYYKLMKERKKKIGNTQGNLVDNFDQIMDLVKKGFNGKELYYENPFDLTHSPEDEKRHKQYATQMRKKFKNDFHHQQKVDECGNCRKSGIKLKVCSSCKVEKYCSRSCQINHRPIHKRRCKKMKKHLENVKNKKVDSTSFQVVTFCSKCGIKRDKKDFKLCGRCRSEFYCDKKCQLSHC